LRTVNLGHVTSSFTFSTWTCNVLECASAEQIRSLTSTIVTKLFPLSWVHVFVCCHCSSPCCNTSLTH
uniref:Uncharacterized protein n=1 Tax=Nothobranchius furzeri TaxID=105023 RepID=A0A8C6Q3P8_NOTFU